MEGPPRTHWPCQRLPIPASQMSPGKHAATPELLATIPFSRSSTSSSRTIPTLIAVSDQLAHFPGEWERFASYYDPNRDPAASSCFISRRVGSLGGTYA